MHKRIPLDRAESVFEDFKSEYTPNQAVIEANRCLFCSDAPCVQACPTKIDVPQFIRKIATGNLKGAARTIFDANILGMSCARVCPVEVLCVGDCVYNALGVPPIQIGKLQRHATDHAFEAGWRFFEAGPDSGKKVALIGGGPASLAAAHELRRLGHACTIFEKRALAGGLNTTGVAPYKMRADKSLEEVEWVLGIGGIELRTGAEVGSGPTLADLERDFDAVFVGVGLGPDTPLGVPGEDLAGVYGAVDYIERMKLGQLSLEGVGRAVVVGGGNTAVDCVRELIGLGVAEVTLIYRGKQEKMPAYVHEWAAAREAGARALFQALPIGFEGSARVEQMKLVRTGEDKRPIPASEFSEPVDLVLVAIGQSKLGAQLAALEGVRSDNGRLIVDAHGATGRAGWYAGGDCANGGKEVVNAAAEGKVAAAAIHRYLMGEAHA
jgi:dihydropyrimidine dehydrogenase (NAD+) subunit PreT